MPLTEQEALQITDAIDDLNVVVATLIRILDSEGTVYYYKSEEQDYTWIDKLLGKDTQKKRNASKIVQDALNKARHERKKKRDEGKV